MEITHNKTSKTVTLCEKFVMPSGTPYENLQNLLEQRFSVAKKLYFPNWNESWWDTHIPDSNGKEQIVEWYTHMPKDFLVV
jgi:hypothetical protein